MKIIHLFAALSVLALTGVAALAQDDAPKATDADIYGPPLEETHAEVTVPQSPRWKRSLDFGATGATGNTVEQDINIALIIHRVTEKGNYDLNATYRFSSSDNEETDNRLFAIARRTWLFEKSKWGVFTQFAADIDQFKAWDQRYTGHAGLSYRIIDVDKTFLESRVGLGGIWTLGKEFDDTIDPEGTIGLSLRHDFNDKLSINLGAQYFPNLKDTSEFRYQYILDFEYSLSINWSFKIGIEDLFDSNPDEGDVTDDFRYSFKLAWKF